jgi:signal transduction histidine kinase
VSTSWLSWRLWVARHSSGIDVTVGAAILVSIELQLMLAAQTQHRPVAMGAGGVLGVAVAVRRRWPTVAVVAAMTAMAVQAAAGCRLAARTVGAIPAVMLVFYWSGTRLTTARGRVVFGIALGLLLTGLVLAHDPPSQVLFNTLVVGVVPGVLGWVLRLRSDSAAAERALAERIDSQREEQALSAMLAERTRIARELHDVIAHSVSVMVIQAGGARRVLDSDPARAERALGLVERAGREAMVEVRRLCGVLDAERPDFGQARLPSLADVPAMIQQLHGSGIAGELSILGEQVPVSTTLSLCAFRIVQEALTNVIKHAGSAQVWVQIDWTDSALEIAVRDEGRGSLTTTGTQGGHGIIGMRERVSLLGGSLEARPLGPAEGFYVRARLPLGVQT